MNSSHMMFDAPAASVAALRLPVPDSSPSFPRFLRQAVEAEVDRLISMLDEMEPDSDFEPSLAGFDGGADDEREADGDGWDSDCEDSDHSGAGDMQGLLEQERGEGTDLGCTEAIDQSQSWEFPKHDRTQRNCAVMDGEPSLGWVENHGAGWISDEEPNTRQTECEADDDAEPWTVPLKDSPFGGSR